MTTARAAGKQIRAMGRKGPIVVAGIALLAADFAAVDSITRRTIPSCRA